MVHTRFLMVLVVLIGITDIASATLGPAPSDTAVAGYFSTTGEIIVSINGVNNWFIESASGSLTGDEPSFASIVLGSFLSNDDNIIGETGFTQSTGTDVSLGNVAATGLPSGDLTISWNAGLGMPTQTGSVQGNIDPDYARINGPFVIDLATDPLNITLDASDSGPSGPELDFSWDIDGVLGFEILTGTTPTLDIADVSATFGGIGVYTVNVLVAFFEGGDVASTTVTIINTPEPTALALAGLGIAVVSSMRRRRNI